MVYVGLISNKSEVLRDNINHVTYRTSQQRVPPQGVLGCLTVFCRPENLSYL